MVHLLKKIAFVAIIALTAVGCQKEDLKEQAINAEAQEFALPEELYFTSVRQLPEGATLTARNVATNITVSDVEGDYSGRLYEVKMNGNKKSDVEDTPIYITEGFSNNTFDFELPPFQVGSMPGSLSVKIKGLTLNSDGTFYADGQNNSNILNKAVKLNIIGLTREYDVTLMKGSFSPVSGLDGVYELDFVLKCEKSIWKFKIFTAEVKYKGEQE